MQPRSPKSTAMVSISPSSVHSWPPYIDHGKLCRLRGFFQATLKEKDCALIWRSRVSAASASSFLPVSLCSNSSPARLASAISHTPLLVAPVIGESIRPVFEETGDAVALQCLLKPHAPVLANARLCQLHRRHALRSFRNRVPHIFL